MMTGAGVEPDWSGDKYRIFFSSIYNSKKFYLGDDEVVEDPDKAIESDDIKSAINELSTLLQDDEFLEYLEGMFVF